jgi:superfamily II DNA or RNA helicase
MAMVAKLAWPRGARVRVRGRRWRVDGVTTGVECAALRLREIDGDARRALTILTPFDRPLTLERSTTPRRVKPRRWLHELERALVDIRPFGALAAMARTTTRLLPYQLEPALAMVGHGATRVLIADAVGLGKTIEAGIVLLELVNRDDGCRGIVLVPAGLREQWAAELARHFALTTTQADASWLRRVATELPPDVNPWSLPGIYIASHDFVKRPEVLRSIEDVTWDLVVVDEAHAASSGTDRRAAIHALACRSRRVLLLTATPNAGDAGLGHLCDIGRLTATESNIVVFARARADVDARPPRKSLVLAVRPSAAERHMHRVLERYSAQVWQETAARGDERARLVSIILRKRALSSASSLLSSISRRLTLLAHFTPDEAQQLALPLGDEDPLPDHEPEGELAAPGLDDPVRERRWLASVAEAARAAARAETKLRALVRLLRRVSEPAIVFTEYRDTLALVARHLTPLRRPLVMLHGGLSPTDRARATRVFNEGGHTLLATDAAAEGLNLHHHCRLVIHYELPWNPARLEQRAGRVDRLGQDHRVHEIALVAADTAERLVIAPLAQRAAHARGAPGGSPLLEVLSESDVAHAVMEGTGPRAARAHTDVEATTVETTLRDEGQVEAERLTLERRWRARSERSHGRRDSQRPIKSETVLRQPSLLESGTVVIYLLMVEDSSGRYLHGEPLVIHVDGRLEVDDASIVRRVERSLEQTKVRVAALESGSRAALAQRDVAIHRARASTARALVQQDLFDHRISIRHRDATAALPFNDGDGPQVVVHGIARCLASIEVRRR